MKKLLATVAAAAAMSLVPVAGAAAHGYDGSSWRGNSYNENWHEDSCDEWRNMSYSDWHNEGWGNSEQDFWNMRWQKMNDNNCNDDKDYEHECGRHSGSWDNDHGEWSRSNGYDDESDSWD